MHELGIAVNIVEIVEREIVAHRYGRVSTVALRIGKMTDVDHEALRFGFEVTTRDTSLSGARLEIEAVPIRVRCDDCSKESEVERYQFACHDCGSLSVHLLQGTELDISYLEIGEQDEGTEPNTETRPSQ
jgi:hydrogenase nickel incorporation protein HypA/HybF